MQAPLRKTALSVALLSVGLAMSAMAQNPGSQGTTGGTSGSSAGATSGSTSGASNSGATSRGAMSGSASATSASKSGDNLARGDRKFIEDAARGGMAEVQLGQLAAQKGQSSEVKQFGQKMVDDHSKANDQLKSIASSKNVTLPTDLDRAHKRDYDRLSKLSGAEFDREFMKHMVSDHKKDVSDFRKESRSGKDTEVKGFASTTLPTLEQHLQMAQQTDAAVRTSGRGASTARTNASSGSTGAMSGGSTGATSGGSTGMSGGTSSGGTTGGATSSGSTASGGTSTGSMSSGGTSSGSTTGTGTTGSKGK